MPKQQAKTTETVEIRNVRPDLAFYKSILDYRIDQRGKGRKISMGAAVIELAKLGCQQLEIA